MIKATILPTGGVRIWASPDSVIFAAALPGATRNAKMPPHQWNMPFTLESVNLLRDCGAQFAPELETAAADLVKVHTFVEQQKVADAIVPIAEVPLKPDCKLFTHQVKAYNIALVLLGYDPPEE